MEEVGRVIYEWVRAYGADDANVALLLNDRHPAAATAVTEVTADLEIRDLSFGDLRERSERRAAALRALGVRSGDRVGTFMEKGHEQAITALAIWRLGAVQMPLFTALAPGAVAQRAHDAAATAIICDPAHAGPLRQDLDAASWGVHTTDELDAIAPTHGVSAVAVGGDAPFILLYTSSPTGPPRGVPVPVRALAAFHSYFHFGLDVTTSDVYWNATDPGWGYGLYFGLVAPLLAGHQTVQLRAGFDPELTLDVLSTLGVTNFTATPAVYRALRATVKTLPPEITPRRLSSAGEPLGGELAGWAYDLFGTPIYEHYDKTELGVVAGYAHHADAHIPVRAGSAGQAMPGWTLSVLDAVEDNEAKPDDPGRLAVATAPDASPLMWFTGYHNNSAASANRFSPDGDWYVTGDAGTQDEDGYLFFSSRDHDAIVTYGYRVSPMDVENALLGHPAVAEAAVFGVPDEIAGQLVAADVVVTPDTTGDDTMAHALQDYVRERFASHAFPRRVTFVSRLPRTASGKMRRGRAPRL